MHAKKVQNQIVMASRLHAVLDMCPSTTNNPTSNQDPKFTAPSKYTLGTILDPKLTSQDHKQAQIQLQACCIIHIITRSSCPNNRAAMT